jgi:diadenylate cyclase
MVFNRIAPYVATALLVIFQPEIRRALEQLGTNHLFELFSLSSTKDKVAENADDTIDAIVRASFSMGRAKTGALIVIEQKFVLNEYIATGILLDAIVSAPLLVQIFEHNLPLHDGAVVIRGNRITAATCYLPLSENKTISKELGTRHRAGLGISEVTDALTVIVSEETGQVSLTKDGQLYRNVNSDKLRELLGGTKSSEKTQTVWDRLRKGRKRHEK